MTPFSSSSLQLLTFQRNLLSPPIHQDGDNTFVRNAIMWWTRRQFNPPLFDYCSWPTQHKHADTSWPSFWHYSSMPGLVVTHLLTQGVLKLCRTGRVSSSRRAPPPPPPPPPHNCSISLATKPQSFLLCRLFAYPRTERAEQGLEISPISLFDALDDKTVIELPFLHLRVITSLFKWNERKCIANVKRMRDWFDQVAQRQVFLL
jgi:hypothetical protein